VYQGTLNGTRDAFIALFDANGARLWATYYGGSNIDEGIAVAAIGTASNGRIYVVGATRSSDFPRQNLSGAFYQANFGGNNQFDAFVLRLNQDGIRDWTTFYGGGDEDKALAVAIAGGTVGSERVYVTGRTGSTNFPRQNATGAYYQSSFGGGIDDAFILRFDANGAREWATFYGGSDLDWALDIAVSGSPPNERAYVVGFTRSTDFPVKNLAGAYYQGTYGGGQADAFIIRFGSGGEQEWATYYGGGSGTGRDDAFSVAVAGPPGSERVYMVGRTESSDFPLLPLSGAYNQSSLTGSGGDAFLVRFDAGAAREWATLFGGSQEDVIHAAIPVSAPPNERLYIAGRTQSSDFPLFNRPGSYYQPTLGGVRDAFIGVFDGGGIQLWTSYYGGSQDEMGRRLALTGSIGTERVYLAGTTSSGDLPVQTPPGSYNQSYGGVGDAFILRLAEANTTSRPIGGKHHASWRLFSEPGLLWVTCESGGAFEVIDALGRPVAHFELSLHSQYQVPLPAGWYVVRERRTGTYQKVFLP
jgi:hypothetical protein